MLHFPMFNLHHEILKISPLHNNIITSSLFCFSCLLLYFLLPGSHFLLFLSFSLQAYATALLESRNRWVYSLHFVKFLSLALFVPLLSLKERRGKKKKKKRTQASCQPKVVFQLKLNENRPKFYRKWNRMGFSTSLHAEIFRPSWPQRNDINKNVLGALTMLRSKWWYI